MNYWAPHVTVAAVAERDGRFLFVEERVGGEAVLNQPAGHLDPEETLTEAVIRETREETGLEFQPDALLGLYQWANDRGEQFLRLAFAGRIVGREPGHVAEPGIIAVHWLSPEELQAHPAAPRSPMVLRAIQAYQQGQRSPLALLQSLPA